ncbi:hypothetical protein [Lactobacillus amylolyticus]|uniref:hypothetical protein n=1 Tax=Lactobacillus amylolyticus TaxID=83683 RepID=UPI00248F64DE|nr:hypothetical protein [Lactobacillus amylolyticus]
MSKITFFFATMNAGKSLTLLTAYHNYKHKGVTPVLVKPELDTRTNDITSRIGLHKNPDFVISAWNDKTSPADIDAIINATVMNKYDYRRKPIELDEVQFFDKSFIHELCDKARKHSIDVLAFGLLKDFKNHLFSASAVWLEEADSYREIKTVCEKCGHKASCNALQGRDGYMARDVFESKSTLHTGDSEYHVYCSKHWHELYDESKALYKNMVEAE